MRIVLVSSSVIAEGSQKQCKLNPINYQVKFFNNIYKDGDFPTLNYQGRTYAPMSSMLETAFNDSNVGS